MPISFAKVHVLDPSRIARGVTEAVQANPTRDWHVPELCTLAGTSFSSLRARTSNDPRARRSILRRARLEQARSRLTDMRLTVKEIALQLNFSSEFYVSRWFHLAGGMSPSRFRAMLRG